MVKDERRIWSILSHGRYEGRRQVCRHRLYRSLCFACLLPEPVKCIGTFPVSYVHNLSCQKIRHDCLIDMPLAHGELIYSYILKLAQVRIAVMTLEIPLLDVLDRIP